MHRSKSIHLLTLLSIVMKDLIAKKLSCNLDMDTVREINYSKILNSMMQLQYIKLSFIATT